MDALSYDAFVRDVLLPLAMAALMGATLGVNREIRNKPAGMRTHALVSLGAALMTLTAIYIATSGDGYDAHAVSRVVQGVVSGVGFLGAGAILKGESGGRVAGLTTAATVWVAAGLGIASGAGLWAPALTALLLALLVLVAGEPVERLLRRAQKTPDPGRRD